MIFKIESEDNKIVKYVNKLKNTKFMKEEGRFIIETFHLLEMAKKEDIDFVLTLEKLDIDDEIPQYIVNEKIMKKLSVNKSFSKVIAVCKIKEEKEEKDEDLILYLDNLQDPGNIGTILRTALAFNVKTIYSSSFISIYNQKTIQASQGAIFELNLKKGSNKILYDLKKDYKIVGTALNEKTIDLREFNAPQKIVLVLGNEGNGVSDEVLDLCDYIVKIPITNIESLNVGIAGGILLYTLRNSK